MKKLFLLAAVLACTLQVSRAQSSELGIALGISSYKGDISHSLFQTRFWHFAAGVHFRRSFNNRWSYRLGGYYGTVSGDDSRTSDPFNQFRNLNFKSSLLEGHMVFEFNFFEFQTANRRSTWTPYLMGGVSVFRFNPKGQLGDDWFELQPLGTEGQGTAAYPDRTRYRRLQIAIPFGGGFKFRLGERFGLNIEVGARRTYTDYLDDISTTYPDKAVLLAENGPMAVLFSDRTPDMNTDLNTDRQRGDAAHKDWYMFAMVQLNFTLSRKYNDNCEPFEGKLR